MSKRRPGPSTYVKVALIAVAIVLVVTLLAVFVVVPALPRGRLERELALRELELVSVGRSVPWFGSLVVHDLVVGVRGAPEVVSLTMPTVDVILSGTSVARIDVPRLSATIRGTSESIAKAADRLQAAQRKLPKESRHPIDVRDGTMSAELHGGSEIGDLVVTFDKIAASIRFDPEDTRLRLEKGRVRAGNLDIRPWTATVRATRDTRRVTARAGADKEASFEWTASDDEQEASFSAEGLALSGKLATGGKSALQIDFEHATASGSGSFRSDAKSIETRGDLKLEGLGWSPLPVGPVVLRPGPNARLVWSGKGTTADDVLKLDGSRLELSLGGVVRTLRISGQCSSLRQEPALDLRWEVGPLACSEVAQEVAAARGAGILSGLAGSLVSGSLLARGTVTGPLLETASWKQDVQVVQGCAVELPSPFR